MGGVVFCTLNYMGNIFFSLLHMAGVKNSTEAAGKDTFFTQEICGLKTSSTIFIPLVSPAEVTRNSFPHKLQRANEIW